MLAKTLCYALGGIDGIPITVECNLSNGLPAFELVAWIDRILGVVGLRLSSV